MTSSFPKRRGPGRGTAVVVAGALLAGACASSSVPAPRPIRLGHDTCAACRETIQTLDAAAQVVYTDGSTKVYDDIGCLATHVLALEGGGQFYVQFSGGRGWVPVEDAHFALEPGRKSPRGYTYFAHTEDEARRLDVDGWARGWADVVTILNRREHQP